MGGSYAIQVQRVLSGVLRCVAAQRPGAPARMRDCGHFGGHCANYARLPLDGSSPNRRTSQADGADGAASEYPLHAPTSAQISKCWRSAICLGINRGIPAMPGKILFKRP